MPVWPSLKLIESFGDPLLKRAGLVAKARKQRHRNSQRQSVVIGTSIPVVVLGFFQLCVCLLKNRLLQLISILTGKFRDRRD